jgi:hypothetical protein
MATGGQEWPEWRLVGQVRKEGVMESVAPGLTFGAESDNQRRRDS